MVSEQKQGTIFQPSEPKPCANNCGFFGTAANRNLCSKCYRHLLIQEDRSGTAKAAVEKSLHSTTATVSQLPANLQSAELSSSSAEPLYDPVLPSKAVNRCFSCNKKVSLTGFVCKCGSTFCGAHRYPEKHECSYDFKVAGREAISKANPVVKADKIDGI